jgi:hypothetical protein
MDVSCELISTYRIKMKQYKDIMKRTFLDKSGKEVDELEMGAFQKLITHHFYFSIVKKCTVFVSS